MNIKSLKISNILSFDYIKDFEDAPNNIEFSENMTIIVGSNGSGKSNIIEIISRLFDSYFFKKFYTDKNGLKSLSLGTDFKPIQENEQASRDTIGNSIPKNLKHFEKESIIEIHLKLNDVDLENIKYICQNFALIKEQGVKYCKDFMWYEIFEKLKWTDLFVEEFAFKFKVENVRNGNLEFSRLSSFNSVLHQAFHDYLKYFVQIQNLLQLIETDAKQTVPFSLKNPFLLISSMRQHSGFIDSLFVNDSIDEQLKSQQAQMKTTSKSYTEASPIYQFTALRWSKLFRQHIRDAGYENAQNQFRHKTGPLATINEELKANLGYHIDIQFSSGDDIPISLYKDSEKINFQQLSMGERSIIHLLFCIYGFDIKNGVLLIDEPELHLHVNMQKAYFEILKNATKSEKIQIIVVTHSSVFIDEKTIGNTHRFAKIDGYTKIFSPQIITQSEKDLVQILTYTNSSRIFFSNNVLMVEGDSDEYFYRYFYEKHIKLNIIQPKSLEIIHIGGKNNFKRWSEFLKIFGIQCFFICDLDNLNEFKILQNIGVDLKDLQNKHKEILIKKINENRVKQRSKDGVELLKSLDNIISKQFQIDDDDKKHLEELWLYLIDKQSYSTSTLIEFLKDNRKDVLAEIFKAIEKLYDEQQVFILKEGALEEYIGNGSNKLDNVISFCEKEFENWILTSKRTNSSKLNELENIFSKIQELQI